MIKNNFDQSSTGVNCEIRTFWDNDYDRWEFSESFDSLGENIYFFSNWGNNKTPSDVWECFDFSECTAADFEAYCKSLADNEEDSEEYCNRVHDGDWKDFAQALATEEGLSRCTVEGFPDIRNAKRLYEASCIVGYREHIHVLWPIETGEGDFYRFDNAPAVGEYFRKLAYGTPYYAEVTVNGETYELHPEAADRYDWDVEELKGIIDKLEIPEAAKDWLKENFPEDPEA